MRTLYVQFVVVEGKLVFNEMMKTWDRFLSSLRDKHTQPYVFVQCEQDPRTNNITVTEHVFDGRVVYKNLSLTNSRSGTTSSYATLTTADMLSCWKAAYELLLADKSHSPVTA